MSPRPIRLLLPSRLLFGFWLVLFGGSALAWAADDAPSERVGLPLLLDEVYLPGPLLEPIPRKTRDLPLIVRLVDQQPAQDGFRYRFEVQGLDPGDYNLSDFLRQVSPERLSAQEKATALPAIPLTIRSELPPGLPAPAELQPRATPRIGGYRALLWVLAIVWLGGLIALIYFKRRPEEDLAPSAPPATLAERLQPLLEKAAQGDLDTEEQAQMERLILAHWRKCLPEVAELPPSEGLSFLRQHPDSAPLLEKLEQWLHAPQSQLSSSDIDALLEPYHS